MKIKYVQHILLLLVIFLLLSCNTITNSDEFPVPSGNFADYAFRSFKFSSNLVSSPIVEDGFLYVQTEESLYKLDSKFNILWECDIPSYVGVIPPLITTNHIVAPARTGQFVLVSAETGEIQWDDLSAYDFDLGNNIKSIATNDNFVSVARFNSSVSVYDIDTGEIIWKETLPYRSVAYLQIYGSELFVAAKDYLVSYDIYSGEQIWSIKLRSFVGPIAIYDQILFVIDGFKDMSLIAFDLTNREIVWQTHLEDFYSNSLGDLLVDQDSIYITGEGILALSRQNGEIKWKSNKVNQLGPGVIFREYLYVRDNHSRFYEIDIFTGNITGELFVGRDSLNYGFIRSPIVFENDLWFASNNEILIYSP